MFELQVFKNQAFSAVRAFTINQEVWFVGKDVVEALEYDLDNNRYIKYIERHCDMDDCKFIDKETRFSQGNEFFDYKLLGQRGGYVINEYALIDLTLSSPLPKAKEFKKWITHEVIPQLMQTGSYLSEKHKNEIKKLIAQNKRYKAENKKLREENKMYKSLHIENGRAMLPEPEVKLPTIINKPKPKNSITTNPCNNLSTKRIIARYNNILLTDFIVQNGLDKDYILEKLVVISYLTYSGDGKIDLNQTRWEGRELFTKSNKGIHVTRGMEDELLEFLISL